MCVAAQVTQPVRGGASLLCVVRGVTLPESSHPSAPQQVHTVSRAKFCLHTGMAARVALGCPQTARCGEPRVPAVSPRVTLGKRLPCCALRAAGPRSTPPGGWFRPLLPGSARRV